LATVWQRRVHSADSRPIGVITTRFDPPKNPAPALGFSGRCQRVASDGAAIRGIIGAGMPGKRVRRIRPYRPSGMHRSLPTPEQQVAAASLRDRLLADRGGPEHATEAETVLVDLIAMGATMHHDAARFLVSLPRPWVDRRSNKSIRLVHDVRRLGAHVAKLLAHLGYDRRPVLVEDLRTIVARQASQPATDPVAGPATDPVQAPGEPPTSPPPPEDRQSPSPGTARGSAGIS
jgi:hypothetical protein